MSTTKMNEMNLLNLENGHWQTDVSIGTKKLQNGWQANVNVREKKQANDFAECR